MTLIIAKLFLYLFSATFVIKFLINWLRANLTIIQAFTATFILQPKNGIFAYVSKVFEYSVLVVSYAYIMSN